MGVICSIFSTCLSVSLVLGDGRVEICERKSSSVKEGEIDQRGSNSRLCGRDSWQRRRTTGIRDSSWWAFIWFSVCDSATVVRQSCHACHNSSHSLDLARFSFFELPPTSPTHFSHSATL
ncbi:hypothetical protein R3P38DRAFT_1264277 [Favolaschia claudopus]|uniref:Secreted protein n=1 Tax=Favolaschia claudopus TaxID=2862362 RepID=A0AAW0B0X1_9AGAR